MRSGRNTQNVPISCDYSALNDKISQTRNLQGEVPIEDTLETNYLIGGIVAISFIVYRTVNLVIMFKIKLAQHG
jgi:hypothetical protein